MRRFVLIKRMLKLYKQKWNNGGEGSEDGLGSCNVRDIHIITSVHPGLYR